MNGAPALGRSAVITGILIAAATGIPLSRWALTAGATILGFAAPVFGCALGGFVAGNQAKRDGLYQGAVVGALWVGLEALGVAPAPAGIGLGGPAETVALIAFDVVLLCASCTGGWIATRASR